MTPFVISKPVPPTKPMCFQGCDRWQIDAYNNDVENYNQKIKRYFEEIQEYADNVDKFYKKAVEYIECMSS